MDISFLRNKTVGIIGNGYLGQNLYKYLSDNTTALNTKILIFDRNSLDDIKNYKFDYFFNTAGNSGDFRQNTSETVDSNLTLTTFLLEILTIKYKYIALSSTRVYGFSEDKNILFDEKFLPKLNFPSTDFIYDGTKMLLESILLNRSKISHYGICIARLSNVYGNFNSLDDSTLIKKIVKHKIQNAELILARNIAETKKDYIYISDAICGLLACCEAKSDFEIYNIASGESYSAIEISNFINLNLAVLPSVEKAQFSNISVKKALAELNFKASENIISGLNKTINFYNK